MHVIEREIWVLNIETTICNCEHSEYWWSNTLGSSLWSSLAVSAPSTQIHGTIIIDSSGHTRNTSCSVCYIGKYTIYTCMHAVTVEEASKLLCEFDDELVHTHTPPDLILCILHILRVHRYSQYNWTYTQTYMWWRFVLLGDDNLCYYKYTTYVREMSS